MRMQLVPLGENQVALSTIALPRPVILIGRHTGCDARLAFPQISRRHCCLIQVDQRWLVRDLGSRHGVHVNGRRVDVQAPIVPGDEVAIGHFLFRFESDGPSLTKKRS